MERITSRANPLLGHMKKLIKDRSYRREKGEFLCDGVKMLEEAIKWGAEITAVLVSDGLDVPLPQKGRIAQVPPGVMESVSPMKAPQGVVFTCKIPSQERFDLQNVKTLLLLDGLQDPGNVGTIWRSASAFGTDGLLLTGHSADPYNWKAVRASMGAVFRLPVMELEYTDLKALCDQTGLPLFGTALRDDTEDLRSIDPAQPCILAVGSEGPGLSSELLSLCEKTVKIPMESGCESLNAAMAATVALWERYRFQ